MTASWRLAVKYGTPVDLPVKVDFDEPNDPVGTSKATLAGARISQRRAWLRTWPLPFGICTDAEVATWRQWIDGTHGAGPFELWIGAALFPVLVNISGFAPHHYQKGLRSLVVTFEEVGL